MSGKAKVMWRGWADALGIRTKRLGLLVLVSLLTLPVGNSVSHAASATTEHRPDLRTRKPTQLMIDYDAGKKLLRFTNVVWNAGNGPLELRPQHDPVTDTTVAYQRIYSHDAHGKWYLLHGV